MGQYTELWFRAELRSDTPDEVVNVLKYLVGAEGVVDLPDHPFFSKPRWDRLGSHGSVYFPNVGDSEYIEGDPNRSWEPLRVALHGNLKDYGGEIDMFFDWIDPYVDAAEGAFVGYALGEESDGNEITRPLCYYKGFGAEYRV